MSGKLDQSLDQIMKDGGSGAGRRQRKPRPARNAATKAKAAIAAPTGGVQKNTKASTRAAKVAAVTRPTAPLSGDSKIIVSNLPEDVTENLIKDYFGQTIGSVKKVLLTYGPTGRSRGVATITFSKPDSGAKAAKQLDGVKVDNKPMKIEVVVGARDAPAPAPQKTLADRVAQPKNAAKERQKGAPTKANAPATNGAKKGKPVQEKKAGRGGKPKRKTAEELDAEMADYFGGDAGAANGSAQPVAAAATAPATNGADAGMVDEIA